MGIFGGNLAARRLNDPLNVRLIFSRMKKTDVLTPIWACVLWLALPLIWNYFFDVPYIFADARGLQSTRINGPLLFCVFCWALILSVPKFRTPSAAHGAGGFILAMAFFLSYFSEFAHTAGYALIAPAGWLLKAK
jgi:hypothetical protein